MYYELALIPLFLVIFLFVVFWIVAEGTRWQKHRILGPFARIIQTSPFRAFIIFLLIFLATIPICLSVLSGFWLDVYLVHRVPSNTVPVVDTLLIILVLSSAMIPVVWSHFRTWRQAARSAAEMRVRSSA